MPVARVKNCFHRKRHNTEHKACSRGRETSVVTLHNLGTLRPSAGKRTPEPRPIKARKGAAGLSRLVLFGVERKRLRQRWGAARRGGEGTGGR